MYLYLFRAVNGNKHFSCKIPKNSDTQRLAVNILKSEWCGTVMILSFRTDRSGQTVQTQIRLLLEEQSDLGLHCLQFRLHLFGALLYGKFVGILYGITITVMQPKYVDKMANSVDPGQTVPSGSTLSYDMLDVPDNVMLTD